MIVLSLALVIAAAVALFIGLFVTTGLQFIYIAIGLCLVSLLLLWFGTRSRKADAPDAPSAPVYGGVRSGSTAAPVRRTTVAGEDTETGEVDDVDELDALTSPERGDVVRTTSARDRAAARVAEAASADQPADTPPVGGDEEPTVQVVDAEEATTNASAAGGATAKKATAKKATAKKATAKKATAKKATAKKATAKKATAKKATAKKATAKKATAGGTRGNAARERLAQIPGVGPAKQEALLEQYGSLEAVRDASVDDIVANVRGFGKALATRVKDAL